MQIHRIETTISSNGELNLRGVPFRAGERVEMTIVSLPRKNDPANRYPLRGKPFQYMQPFEGAAQSGSPSKASL